MPPETDVVREDRRRTNAAATRDQVRQNARRAFAQYGYSATRVEHIADATGVSPATVYSTVGGKSGLLAFWIDQWSTDETFRDDVELIINAATTEGVIQATVISVLDGRRRWADVVAFARTAAATDELAAQLFQTGTHRYRSAIDQVAARLSADDTILPNAHGREGMVGDVLWFFLGFHGFDVLIDQNGWSDEQAAQWVESMLLITLRSTDAWSGGVVFRV